MKKILGALLMLSMAIGGTVIATNTTKDVQAATRLQSNRWYEGMTDGDNEQIYTYKMEGPGYFYYQVIPDQAGHYNKNDEFESSTSHEVNTKMISNYKMYVDRNADYSDGGYTSEDFSFKKGATVTIKVKETDWTSYWNGYYRTHYKIKVTFVKVKNFEKENNNSRSTANKIKKGINYTGLVRGYDVDWFVFKAPKTKKYKIKVVDINEASSNSLAYVYKGYKEKGRTTIWAGDGWKTAYSGKLKKGQKLYVKIQNNGWSNSDINRMYKIRVK